MSHLTIAAIFAVAGCSKPQQGTGSARFTIGVHKTLQGGDVTRVTIDIAPAQGPDVIFDLNKIGGQWVGTANYLPAGAAIFSASGYVGNASTPSYRGSQAGTIAPNAQAQVSLLLEQVDAPQNYSDGLPEITSVIASSNSVALQQNVDLTATAYDPDGPSDLVSTLWTAAPQTGQTTNGTFTSANALATSWQSDQPGNYLLTLTVTDGKGAKAAISFAVTVLDSTGAGAANINIGFNEWPGVSKITASPGQINAGETAQLAAIAHDDDDAVLHYGWSDDCGGSFATNNSTSASTAYMAPAVAPEGPCTITLTVTDGRGGSNTGALAISVGHRAALNAAPQIDNWSSTATRDFDGSTVTLNLSAHDPEGQGLTFTWTALDTGGSVSPTTDPSTSPSAAAYSPAPNSTCDGLVHGARVTVQDTTTGVSTHDFVINTCPRSCDEEHSFNPTAPSGFFTLDPDGPGGGAPFQAWCDFTRGQWPTGKDGDLILTNGATQTLAAGGGSGPGGAYDFRNINIDATSTLTLSGDGWVVIGASGNVNVDGTVDGTPHHAQLTDLAVNAPANDGTANGEQLTYLVNQAPGGSGGGGSCTISYGYYDCGGGGGGPGGGGGGGNSQGNETCMAGGGGGGSSSGGGNGTSAGCGNVGSNGGASASAIAQGGASGTQGAGQGYGGAGNNLGVGVGGGGGGGGAMDYHDVCYDQCTNTCCIDILFAHICGQFSFCGTSNCNPHFCGNVFYGSGGGGGGGGGPGLNGQPVYLKVLGSLTGSGTINLSGGPGGTGANGLDDAYGYGGAGGGGGGGSGGSGGTLALRMAPKADGTPKPIPGTLAFNFGGGAGGPGGAGGNGYSGPGAPGAEGSVGTAGNIDYRSYSSGGATFCGDTQNDPSNCGACGTVCPGGACVAGRCQACSTTAGQLGQAFNPQGGPTFNCPNMKAGPFTTTIAGYIAGTSPGALDGAPWVNLNLTPCDATSASCGGSVAFTEANRSTASFNFSASHTIGANGDSGRAVIGSGICQVWPATPCTAYLSADTVITIQSQ